MDWHNPTQYILALEQEGFGLPGRDYYLKEGEPFVGHRAAYLAYIEGVLQRAGIANVKPRAQAILTFEIELAKRQWTPEQLRDTSKLFHIMSKRQLQAYAPGFNWTAYLKASGYADVDRLQLATDRPIKDMAAVYAKTPLDTLRSYVAFHYLNHYAPLLADTWSDAYFDLFSRRLMGIVEQRPLEKRALKIVNDKFGEELGKLYVARYFPPESMTKTQEMVGYILQSMQERLKKLDWMDEPTRKEALAKLASFGVLVGYLTQWHDHSSVNIHQDDLVGNMDRLAQCQGLCPRSHRARANPAHRCLRRAQGAGRKSLSGCQSYAAGISRRMVALGTHCHQQLQKLRARHLPWGIRPLDVGIPGRVLLPAESAFLGKSNP